MQEVCIKQAAYAILMQVTIVISCQNYRCDAKDLYMGDKPSIYGKQTVYRWETHYLYSVNTPSVFLLLELYVFMYYTIN